MTITDCNLCYGTGRTFHEGKGKYITCPNCGELSPSNEVVIPSLKHECGLCYGTGRTYNTAKSKYEVCPNCNELEELFNISPYEAYKRICTELKIPDEYIGVMPITDVKQLGGVGDSVENAGILNSKLSQLIADARDGLLSKDSFIIALKPHMDKELIPYSFMQMYREKGFSVTPYITITELLGLQALYGLSNVEYKELVDGKTVNLKTADSLITYDGFRLLQEYGKTYYDFINTEVCFIKIPSNPPAPAFYALADLIEQRANKGLPTYVISYTNPYRYKAGGLQYLISKKGKASLRYLTDLSLTAKRQWNETYKNPPPPPRASSGMGVNDF